MVYESEIKNIATAEIQYPQDTVHVIVVHGPQEGANQDEIDEFYVDLHAEVERGLEGGKRIIITGDLNARLEQDDGIVPTGNGKRLNELIRKYVNGGDLSLSDTTRSGTSPRNFWGKHAMTLRLNCC